KTMYHNIEQPGEIHAFKQTPIFVKVSGYVAKVHKDIGDPVKEGELLAELAVPELSEELTLKQAEVAVADAKIKQAQKLLSAAEAHVKEVQASRLRVGAELQRAESTYARFKKSASVLSAENLDEARLSVEASKAAVAEI